MRLASLGADMPNSTSRAMATASSVGLRSWRWRLSTRASSSFSCSLSVRTSAGTVARPTLAARPQAAVAGDEVEAALLLGVGRHQQGLEDAVGADAGHE